MSKHWKVYMVRCAKGALYTGIALDVLKRVAQHNAGTGAKAIHALGRPVKLVYSEIVGDKRLALKREYMIKHMTRVQKEKLIASQWLTSEDQTYYRAWD